MINPQTGLMDPPIYPCFKDNKGLCKVRYVELKEPKLGEPRSCAFTPPKCKYYVSKPEKQEKLI